MLSRTPLPPRQQLPAHNQIPLQPPGRRPHRLHQRPVASRRSPNLCLEASLQIHSRQHRHLSTNRLRKANRASHSQRRARHSQTIRQALKCRVLFLPDWEVQKHQETRPRRRLHRFRCRLHPFPSLNRCPPLQRHLNNTQIHHLYLNNSLLPGQVSVAS